MTTTPTQTQKPFATVKWTLFSFGTTLTLIVLGVLYLGSLDVPDGKPPITDSVTIQIISSVTLLLSVIIPSLIGVNKRTQMVQDDTAVIKHEVKNNHGTNLREESDTRHNESQDKLDFIIMTLGQQDRAISGLTSDIRGIRRDIGRNTDDIRDIQRPSPHRRTVFRGID